VEYARMRRRRLQIAQAIFGCMNRGFFSRYFYLWRLWALGNKRRKKNHAITDNLMRCLDSGLRRVYFNKWVAFYDVASVGHFERKREELKKDLETLHARIAMRQHLVERQKVVDETQRLIDELLAAKAKKLAKNDELRQDIERINDTAHQKRLKEKEKRDKSVREQVEDIIAMLKCKLLNFNTDFGIISKVGDKSKQVPVIKIFLEAHQAVKRVIVELTGQPHLGVEDKWPLTDEMIDAMKSHYVEQILVAIKTMIITFDIMTLKDRSELTTDGEIVINGEWLLKLADYCIETRVKKLGKAGAFRAKK